MRLKDPFSLKTADMTKRSNKPKKPRDEDSSDEVGGKDAIFHNRQTTSDAKNQHSLHYHTLQDLTFV